MIKEPMSQLWLCFVKITFVAIIAFVVPGSLFEDYGLPNLKLIMVNSDFLDRGV